MQITKDIKWLYNNSLGVRKYIVLYIFFGLLGIFSSLLFVWLTKSLIDMAVNGGDNRLIIRYIVFLAATIVLQQILVVARGKISNLASNTLMNRLRVNLFGSIMRSEWGGKELRHTGDVVNRIESDSRKIGEVVCITLPSIIITLIQFLASFRFLQILDARLSWVIVVIMPVTLIVSKRYMFTMRKLTQAIRATDSSLQSHVQEQIQNRVLINTVGDTAASVDKLQEWSDTLLGQTMQRVSYSLFSRVTVQLGFGAGYIVALIWGIYGLQSGAVTFGVMTAFLQLVSQIQNPSVNLATHISTAAQCTASIDRIDEILQLQREQRGDDNIIEGSVGVRATALDFEYSDGGGRKILSSFNYVFEPNSLHVIVGHTGVGKSTLIRLMLGLLTPTSGRLELYNNIGAEVECSPSTRKNFVYVPQGNTLMSGTVKQNLLLAKPTATDEELRTALHTAVADFVLDLPDGIDTMCGERGAGLSEGEAQRIAIARGLLQSGGVMLLDEPTSALDSATEQLLVERLSKYAQNRTLIMVTHRDTAAQLLASSVKLG